MTGKHTETKKQNEQEAERAKLRDRAERERLIFRQLDLRRTLDQQIKQARQERAEQVAELHRDIANYGSSAKARPPSKRAQKKTMRHRIVRESENARGGAAGTTGQSLSALAGGGERRFCGTTHSTPHCPSDPRLTRPRCNELKKALNRRTTGHSSRLSGSRFKCRAISRDRYTYTTVSTVRFRASPVRVYVAPLS